MRIRAFGGTVSGQLKDDVQYSRGICGLTIPQCRLESNLFRGPYCGIIEPMTQTADHTHDVELTGSFQHGFDEYFAFDSQIPSLFSIDGVGLGKNFRGNRLRCFYRPGFRHGRSLDIGVAKSALPHRRPRVGDAAVAVARGHAITETGARDYAAYAFRSARTIPIAGAGRQIE